MAIIESLLDTDLYKFTMGQAALHQFPWVDVKYEFKCRSKVKWTKRQLGRIKYELEQFCQLRFYEDELCYLRDRRFLKKSYIDFLRLYSPSNEAYEAWIDEQKELRITIKGPWFLRVYWEVPLLAIVNQVYFENQNGSSLTMDGTNRVREKITLAKEVGFPFVDFGTRRRHSRGWHNHIIKEIVESNIDNFKGTSNVYLAKKYNLTPIGTMAHEFLQVGQALDVPLKDSQKRMLQAWVDEYRGDLGIALTDVINIDAFLKDFDLYFAKLYDGLRHDSGDPYQWANKVLEHYQKLGIDPKTKTLVFSDGLDFNKAAKLYKTYRDSINVSFGIGTNLTNDFEGITTLPIVMKIVECNGSPVAKISDSPGKGMCQDQQYVDYLKKVFHD
jgi:nicotinate phosphoribosyltransferase